jgi:hypothetical protein
MGGKSYDAKLVETWLNGKAMALGVTDAFTKGETHTITIQDDEIATIKEVKVALTFDAQEPSVTPEEMEGIRRALAGEGTPWDPNKDVKARIQEKLKARKG